MICFPTAKVNLGLHITGKKADGFHNIETILFPIPLYDVLEVLPGTGNELHIHLSGLFIPGLEKSNILSSIYSRLCGYRKMPGLDVYLHKVIPAGAGLGGGSSDAAFFLQLLNQQFDLQLNQAELFAIASETGSDCPFFLSNRPMLATGRGEQLEPLDLDLSSQWLVVHWPGFNISTKEAYQNCLPRVTGFDLKNLPSLEKKEWPHFLRNDFEVSLFQQFPELERIKSELYQSGAYFASLSGSGSSLFALFADEPRLPARFLDDPYTWTFQLQPK